MSDTTLEFSYDLVTILVIHDPQSSKLARAYETYQHKTVLQK